MAGAETPGEGAEKEALAKLDSLPPPPRKAWKNGAPSVRPACVPACQSEDGDFFSFIHVPLLPPPPLKQASRSVNALRALGQVKAAGF